MSWFCSLVSGGPEHQPVFICVDSLGGKSCLTCVKYNDFWSMDGCRQFPLAILWGNICRVFNDAARGTTQECSCSRFLSPARGWGWTKTCKVIIMCSRRGWWIGQGRSRLHLDGWSSSLGWALWLEDRGWFGNPFSSFPAWPSVWSR